MDVIVDTSSLRVLRVPDVGPDGNNLYLVVDAQTGESAFVDAPAEPEQSIALADGTQVTSILITHTHSDHTASLAFLKAHFGAKVYCHPGELGVTGEEIDVPLLDDETVQVGGTKWRVIHNPGHTPGSSSFFRRDGQSTVLFSGDTLFPGGPGWSQSPRHLREEIDSITKRLLPLPPETVVFPGHGGGTTIRQCRAEYTVFASKPHPDDLHGDVLWLSS